MIGLIEGSESKHHSVKWRIWNVEPKEEIALGQKQLSVYLLLLDCY